MPKDRLHALVTGLAIAGAVALPLLVLVPFGWLWLWQNGYALHWLAAALGLSLAALGLRLWALKQIAAAAQAAAAEPGPAGLSPRETAAREAVERLAAEADPARITDRESLTRLGIETVEAVARHMRPELEQPLWSFTVPEALTLIERVSRRLRPLIVENVPLGDRLTIGQIMRIYEWRGLVGTASAAYDIWRVLRLLNPVAAVTQEIRERISKTMYDGLKQELAKRLAATYVREVGGAAIELYSGRLALAAAPAGPGPAPEPVEAAGGDAGPPIRILIAGRTGSGKSSLVNALGSELRAATDALPATREARAYEVQRPGMPPVVLVDTPGAATSADIAATVARAVDSDLVLWVLAADRPDRGLDREVLGGLAAHFASHPERSSPPVLIVLTAIDRLRPFREWSPPYDVATPDGAKARSIREALEAVGEDLARPLEAIVPVALAPEAGAYNVDLLWARIEEALPAAKGAQLLRRIAGHRGAVDWRRLLGQAVGAGRLVAGTLAQPRRGGGSGA